MCRRRRLKDNAGKSKVMVMNGEKDFVLDKSGTDGAKCNRKGTNGRKVAVVIRSIVNAMDFQIECTKSLP